jgi:hypothetical protein
VPTPPLTEEGKRLFREVSERIERAIEAYGQGQYEAAMTELEAALKAQPDNPRARELMGWVKDLAMGKKKLPGSPGHLDDDTLQAVSDALEPDFSAQVEGDTEKTREKLREQVTRELPWDPPPLTSGHQNPPAGTLLGIQKEPRLLTPSHKSKSSAPSVMEDSGQHTREWRQGSSTGKDMPPLDVPELSDEQVQELLALEGAPSLDLPSTDLTAAPPGAQPQLETVAFSGLSAEPAEELLKYLEIEAEPTPEPHRNPLYQAGVLPAGVPETLPPGARKKDSTTPDAELSMGSDEFDAPGCYDRTPTRERRDLLKAVVNAPPASFADDEEEELQLLPALEAPRENNSDEPMEEGTNPTNPFIRTKLSQYTSSETQPKIDDLPPPPSGRDTGRTPALEEMPGVTEAIERGDPFAALDASEQFLASAGGLDSERARPQHSILEQVYNGCIGPRDQIPTHGHPSANLHPRAAFLLSRFDGMSTAEDVLDISGMPRLEALRLLALLIWHGAVQMK